MGKVSGSPLSSVTFRCGSCRLTFSAEPSRVDDAPADDFHPFLYFAGCPECGAECGQAHWERNLMKAHAAATGPRTPEGLAETARNLEGHPTPSEALRTRFNALKHGMNAETATYFPSRPGKYAFCSACDIDHGFCAAQPACQKQTGLFMQTHAAFEMGNPKLLKGLHASLQAALFSVLQQILQTILADGVKIEAPQYYTDKDGVLIVAEYVDENGQRRVIKDIEAHPLLRALGELLTRNNLSLADMGMTVKAIEDEDSKFGQIAHEQTNQETLTEYHRRSTAALELMAERVMRANQQTANDPILIEYQREHGGE